MTDQPWIVFADTLREHGKPPMVSWHTDDQETAEKMALRFEALYRIPHVFMPLEKP